MIEAIRTICAWCGKHMSGPEGEWLTTHGICEPCLKQQLAEGRAVGSRLVPLDDVTLRERFLEAGDHSGGGPVG